MRACFPAGAGLALALLGLSLAPVLSMSLSEEELAAAVRELGDPSFPVRERASRRLWAAGQAAEKALQAALNSRDPEVRMRAAEILEKLKWGIEPDTPPEIVRLIQQYQHPEIVVKAEAVKQLMRSGPRGVTAALRIAAVERDAATRQAVFQYLNEESSQAVKALLAEGHVARAEEVLELCLFGEDDSAVRAYAAYLLLFGGLDERILALTLRAGLPGGVPAAGLLAYLHRAKGNLPAARAAAERSAKPSLVSALQHELGDWPSLARRPVFPEELKEIERLGFQAAYARLGGAEADRDKPIAPLRQFAEGKRWDSFDIWFAAKALLVNERPLEAIAVLHQGEHFASIFEIHCAQLRFADALELVQTARGADGKVLLRLALRQARLLHQLGEVDPARHILSRLGEESRQAGHPSWYGPLVDLEYELGLREEAFAHCAELGARLHARGHLAGVHRVFPDQPFAAEAWWKVLRQQRPDEEPLATMGRLRELFAGKLTDADLASLFDEAERLARPEDRQQLLGNLADTCVALRREAQARAYLQRATELSGSSESWIRLGDAWAGRRLWRRAADCYGRAAQKNRTPLALYLQGWALRQSVAQDGKDDDGRRFLRLAERMVLADDEARGRLGLDLARRGLWQDAGRCHELLLRTGKFLSPHAAYALRRAARDAEARKDYSTAAALAERAFLLSLLTEVNTLEISDYLTIPHGIHRNRARALLSAGKTEEALREIGLCQALLPGDLELPADVVPELERLGRKIEAADLFAAAWQVHEAVCQRYPRAARHHRALGELAVSCGRRLDDGLAHARTAVELAPNDRACLNTLAAIQHLRSRP